MTDHYRQAEQHLDFAAKSTDHPPTEQAHLGYAKAHGVLALIDYLSARPHVDLTGNPERIDMTRFGDSNATVLLDGQEVVTRKAHADE